MIICTPAQIAADRQRPGSESPAVWISRRNIEGGERDVRFEHRNYRGVAGIDGALGQAWRYEFYGLWHSASLLQNYDNYLSNSAISQALQVTTGNGGLPVCISSGRCVPYDIFGTGTVTAQQIAGLEKPANDEGDITEQIIQGSLTGELSNLGLVLPWLTKDWESTLAFSAAANGPRIASRGFRASSIGREGELRFVRAALPWSRLP
jgi:hypothetical protein